MYRSKDREFMERIKRSVLRTTKDQDKEDRKFSLDYLRASVKIEDLHTLAVSKFKGKDIDFGDGSLSPKVVVVTKDPISAEAKAVLEKAFKKIGIEKEVFYTHLRFVKTKKKQEDRLSIFQKLIDILSPERVIVFDNVKMDVKPKIIQVGKDATILSDPAKKEERKKLNPIFKELSQL